MHHLVRTYVQHIHAAPEDVFPLLCPEREKEWLPGWDARMIHSISGVAERGAVFESPHPHGQTFWLVTDYDPPRLIGFARWQPDGLVVHIEIALGRHDNGETAVSIAYHYTAVSDAGVDAMKALTPDAWLKTMTFWQESMNRWFADPAHRP